MGNGSKSMELVFVGEGKVVNALKGMAANIDNISFLPHMPFSEVQAIIAGADYGLVSLEAGIYRYAFPSKTLTYLGLSVPLAVVVEPESELAHSIAAKNLGYSTGGMQVEDIASMFRQMVNERDKKDSYKENAQEYYREHCDREKIIDRWSLLIRHLSSDIVVK